MGLGLGPGLGLHRELCLRLEAKLVRHGSCHVATSGTTCRHRAKPKPKPNPSTSCQGFEEFMAVFPDEDRESYPDMFKLPEGCYEVSLYCRKQGCSAFGRLARQRPLQIVHQAAPSSG